MFSILTRYISRSFLWSFFASLGILAVIVAAFDFAEIQRRTSGKINVTYLEKFKMVAFKLPFIVEQVLPFIVFIAALFIFWRLNRNHELVVTRAAGVSVWQLVIPVACCAWLVGGLDIFLFNDLSSSLMAREMKMEDKNLERHRSGMKLIQSGLWLREQLPENKQAVYRVTKVDLPNGELQNLTVYQFQNNDIFTGRLDAHSAVLGDGILTLKDVWKIERFRAPTHLPELVIPTTLSQDNIQNTGIHPSSISFWKLPNYVDLLEKSGLRSAKYAMYWHAMIARAVWLGMMVLLAAAFTFQPIRSGKTILMITVGLFSGFALYFLRDFTYALGVSEVMPTLVAASIPPLLTGIVATTLLLYQEDG